MARILLVVEDPSAWNLHVPDVAVVAAKTYLTDPAFSPGGGTTRVLNLCRLYQYQSIGYYVSLVAAARGHRPMPDVTTLRDFSSPGLGPVASDTLDHLIQTSLHPLVSDEFTLHVYFGRAQARRYERLALHLFNTFQAPILRVTFGRKEGKWTIRRLGPVALKEVPDEDRNFLQEVTRDFLARGRRKPRQPKPTAYDLAILVNPREAHPPTNERGLKKFVKAAENLGISAEIITREDYARLPRYDALFIRATTSVPDPTFRFARRAEVLGIPVIDDPMSIIRCANKVFLAELLQRHDVRTPKTLVVSKDNLKDVESTLGLPCVLKVPDSAFSKGVVKVGSAEELCREGRRLLDDSDLVVAQAFVPTPFDWRIGVLDGEAIYACRYYMARRHWQIVRHHTSGRKEEGNVDCVPLEEVPPAILRTAVRATRLIGLGLYGVDVKELDGKPCVIEVNDNPSIDAGCEDLLLGDRIYDLIMRSFLRRIEDLRRKALPDG